jgi:FixJ family two-component response regulator
VDSTVFIVDPDPAAQRAVAQLIGTMGLQSELFDSPLTFLATVDPSRAGCIVLEFNLPTGSGLEFQKQLAERGYTLPLIFVTGHSDIATAVTAMKAGAADFMSKPFRLHELYDAIQRAIEQDLAQRRRMAVQEELAAKFARLTPGEKRVLELIVAGQNKQQIAEELCLSVRTIEVRRGKIIKKLQATNLAALIRTFLLMTSKS